MTLPYRVKKRRAFKFQLSPLWMQTGRMGMRMNAAKTEIVRIHANPRVSIKPNFSGDTKNIAAQLLPQCLLYFLRKLFPFIQHK
jgi:hypothetical protein